MARVLGKSLFGIAVALSAAGTAAAQADVIFAEGVKAYRLGRYDEANSKFEQVLAEDLSHQQALNLFIDTERAVWDTFLNDEDERFNKMAKALLNRATVARKERSRDDDRIAELVAEATSGDADFSARQQAAFSLAADHGEFAVPALVQALSNADDEKGQIYAILALQKIGRPATLPLLEALDGDEQTRGNVVAVLSHLKDERSRASLTVLASRDPSDAVREQATKALQYMGAAVEADPAALFVNDARDYLVNSGRGADLSDVVWSYEDGALVSRDVPASLYSFELAKKAALRALRLDPTSSDAKTAMARAYLGQGAAITESLAANPDDEALAPMADRVPQLEMMAAASGLPIMRRAVADSIDDGMIPTAVAGIEMLGSLEDRADLMQSPLIDALDNNNSRISYAAALAVTEASAGGPVPAADRVVANLSEAVTERKIRLVKVIDPDPITQRAVEEAAFTKGIQKSVSDSAASAINDLSRFPNVDVVVLNSELADDVPDTVIGMIRKNDRLANCKILVLSNDPDGAGDRFGDRIDGTIQAPASGDNLRQAVEAALADEPDAVVARADRVAVSASEALQSLAANQVDVTGALANLSAQLDADRSDEVTIPAAAALGAGGSADQLGALLQVLQNDGASVDLKVACANAAGAILGRSGEASAEVFEQLLGVATSEADIALRQAASRALGKASLSPEMHLQLLEALQI